MGESAYRDEAVQLSQWCRENDLLPNTAKTQELVIDFRRKKTDIPPLINGDCVDRVSSFRFLGVHIEEDFTWTENTSELLKKAQQRLYFLRVLRRHNFTQRLLV